MLSLRANVMEAWNSTERRPRITVHFKVGSTEVGRMSMEPAEWDCLSCVFQQGHKDLAPDLFQYTEHRAHGAGKNRPIRERYTKIRSELNND